jgi:hypothetical protein
LVGATCFGRRKFVGLTSFVCDLHFVCVNAAETRVAVAIERQGIRELVVMIKLAHQGISLRGNWIMDLKEAGVGEGNRRGERKLGRSAVALGGAIPVVRRTAAHTRDAKPAWQE